MQWQYGYNKRPSGLRMVHFSGEFSAHAPPGNFLRLKFSKMESSAFWAQMPGFHIDNVMLKYLREKNSQTKGGPGHSGPTPKSALDPRGLNPPYPRTTFLHKKLPSSLP